MSDLARTRQVAVAGGGVVALAAAVAFRRALPEARVVLFAGGAGGADDPGAAAPFLQRFHRLVGLDDALFRRRTGAIAVMEAEFAREGKAPFSFVPLDQVPYLDGIALHQLWLRRRAAGGGPDWPEVARRAGAGARGGGLGLRFDPAAYRALLAEMAAGLGVEVRPERAEPADLAAEFDLAIVTESDGAERVTIDGVPAALDWTVERPGRGSSGLETLILGRGEAAWAHPAWRARARWTPQASRAGRVIRAMEGKRLRVGRAAVQCETFDGQPLAVALAGIVRALELLPRPGASGREAAEYNRRSARVHDALLDWAAARWAPAASLPAGLAALRAQFAGRGRVPFRDEDPLPPGHWISWFLASGERPRQIDLTAMAVGEARLAALFDRM